MQVLYPLYCQRSHTERFESLVFSWTFAQCPALWKRRVHGTMRLAGHGLSSHPGYRCSSRATSWQFDEAFSRCSRRSSSESSWSLRKIWKDIGRSSSWWVRGDELQPKSAWVQLMEHGRCNPIRFHATSTRPQCPSWFNMWGDKTDIECHIQIAQ